MASPPPTSLVPAPTVWPPSNPSGTVIPFPLPWGQTGCCPPGGMDALMKCYCDIQQASAFIGQIMLDQINNNPAITEAIIAAIEKSGSSVPLIGVTNGVAAQPGQVGEFISFVSPTINIPAAASSQTITMGVLQPGDWDCWAFTYQLADVHDIGIGLAAEPAGFSNSMFAFVGSLGEIVTLTSPTAQALISVPSLIAFSVITNQAAAGPVASSTTLTFNARRRR